MKKIIEDKNINFYDEDGKLIMYLSHVYDECIWFFETDSKIRITKDTEIYGLIEFFMNQEYLFGNNVLNDYKDKNKLIWYSDCYYDPDDEYSLASVSCLNIEREDDSFVVWCCKKLDDIFERKHKTYCISFSPCGNGKFTKNIVNGLSLQDDFVMMVYNPLLERNKVLKK